jgi:hypothetical protein
MNMQERNNVLIHVLVDELNRECVKRDACTHEIDVIVQELKDLGVDQQGFPLPEVVADQITEADLADLAMEE